MRVVNPWYREAHVPVIATKRLRLCPLLLSDAGALYEIYSSESVMRYYGLFPVGSFETAVQWLELFQKGFEEGRSMRWKIVEAQSGVFMGTCGFQNMNHPSRRAEIGYELAEAYWNHHYAREAVGAMVRFGFDILNLHRIEALVYPENEPSKKVLMALGFEKEGLLRGYAYFREIYQDLEMYGLIDSTH